MTESLSFQQTTIQLIVCENFIKNWALFCQRMTFFYSLLATEQKLRHQTTPVEYVVIMTKGLQESTQLLEWDDGETWK